MQDYQRAFIDFLVSTGALKFDSYTLKSGRVSPYYFNSGEFSKGTQIHRLGYYYASAIRELTEQPTVIFGPAYKGIPLSVSAAISLSCDYGEDVGYSFDRKEVKSHGKGGWIIGHIPGQGDKVVIVDDVVTDGATKLSAINSLRTRTDAKVAGLVIAIDRKERNDAGGNAIDVLSERAGVEIRAIVSIYDIMEHLPGREIDGRIVMTANLKSSIENYLSEYGVD